MPLFSFHHNERIPRCSIDFPSSSTLSLHQHFCFPGHPRQSRSLQRIAEEGAHHPIHRASFNQIKQHTLTPFFLDRLGKERDGDYTKDRTERSAELPSAPKPTQRIPLLQPAWLPIVIVVAQQAGARSQTSNDRGGRERQAARARPEHDYSPIGTSGEWEQGEEKEAKRGREDSPVGEHEGRGG